MSSKAKKMQAQALAFKEPTAPETRSITVRLDLVIEQDNREGKRSTFMQLDGIPKDLPEEMEKSIVKSAERQFVHALNQRMYLETYSLGCSPKDEHPMFVNLMRADSISVTNVTKVIKEEEAEA